MGIERIANESKGKQRMAEQLFCVWKTLDACNIYGVGIQYIVLFHLARS